MIRSDSDPTFGMVTRRSLWFVSEKDARAACAKGPAVEAAAREKSKTERAEKREAAMAKGYRIARVSEFAGDWTQAIIETDRDREIKCAALDSDGEYLAVENAYITAPVDGVPSGSEPPASSAADPIAVLFADKPNPRGERSCSTA